MIDKFSAENIIMYIVPGSLGLMVVGFFLGMDKISATLGTLGSNDIILAIIFVGASFVAGELLQTIAHMKPLEYISYIFLKFHKPSEIFLLEGNSVIPSKTIQKALTELNDTDANNLINYKKVNWRGFTSASGKDDLRTCDRIFKKMYAKMCDDERVKLANAKFLFARVLYVLGLASIVIASIRGTPSEIIVSSVFTALFIRRARGCAKGLVRETFYKFIYR